MSTESWYANATNASQNVCGYPEQQSSSNTPYEGIITPYGTTSSASSNLHDLTKETALPSLTSPPSFPPPNCFYNTPQGEFMEFPSHHDVKTEDCFQDQGSYTETNQWIRHYVKNMAFHWKKVLPKHRRQNSGHFDGYSGYPGYDNKYESSSIFRWPQSQNILPPYSARVWPRPIRRFPTNQVKESPIKVTLENRSLMEKFHLHCTEMIITKTGRRMFPSPQVTLDGLENSTKYFVLFDIIPADDNRYKFHHFNWVIAGKAEPQPAARMYIHPESPLTGSQWMKQQIIFHKVKLTNNTCDQHGHMILNSMHRYQPRIHVVAACDIYSIQFQPFHTFAFPECQFIAVTAYQNAQITQLKIEHNPFAKGFRKPEKEKREKRKTTSPHQESNENFTKNTKKEEDHKIGVSSRDHIPSNNNSMNNRDISYYDLNHNKWNYNPASHNQLLPKLQHSSLMSQSSTTSTSPYPTNQSRPSFTHGLESHEKIKPIFESSKYSSNPNEFGVFDHAKQLSFPTDFMNVQNKANLPSFI